MFLFEYLVTRIVKIQRRPNHEIVNVRQGRPQHTSCGSVGLKLGRGGNPSGPFCRRLGLSVQCGFKDGLGGVQLLSDQKWELALDGLAVSRVPIGLADEDGLCFVMNAGSVVTCQ